MKYVITIGREYGSGGRYIAQELAKKLGIGYYDNNLLAKVAEESGLSEDYIRENDEKKDSIFAFLGMGDLANTFTAVQNVSMAQFTTIKKIAAEESCVIVGRCADYILKDYDNVVKIFIFAPMKDKVARAVKFYGIDERKAEDLVKKMDKKRAQYYNYFTDGKWGESSNYDLCISSSIGVEETADVIIEYVKKKLGL